MNIYSGTHGYVKYHSDIKVRVYVNLHVETRGYVKFHSEAKEGVNFTLSSPLLCSGLLGLDTGLTCISLFDIVCWLFNSADKHQAYLVNKLVIICRMS